MTDTPSSQDLQAEINALRRKLGREKSARLEAEELLEAKSADLFEVNSRLEATVANRTEALQHRLEEVEALRNQLELERDEALRESQAKTIMFARLSHEIRTPLNGVVGAINFIGDSDIDANTNDWVCVARNSLNELKNILTNAIELARLEQRIIKLEQGEFEISQMLSDIKDYWLPQLKNEQSLEVDIQSGVAHKFMGDAARIRQIIDNLLSNAIKFGGNGVISLQVELIKNRTASQKIRFAVTDHGETLPLEKQNSLFGPTDRSNLNHLNDEQKAQHDEVGQGVGLGLTICREIANLMHADIGVIPVLPKGNSFFIDLRLDIVAREPESTEKNAKVEPVFLAQDAADQQQHLTKRATVLIVEDVPTNQLVMERYLTGFGYAHETAEHGQEAVDMVKRRGDTPYDLILMDIAMPVMDGFDATRHIKALPAPASLVPIIGVSAHVGKSEAQKMRDIGMVTAMEKPVDREMLRRYIEKAMAQSPLPKQTLAQHAPSKAPVARSDTAGDASQTDTASPPPPGSMSISLDDLPDWMDEELLAQVKTDIGNSVEMLMSGLEDGDIEVVKSAYHNLKGILGTFELPRYQEVKALYEEIHSGGMSIDAVQSHDITNYLQQLANSQ